MTLIEFLLARIAEDEAVARKASRQKIAGPLIRWNADSAVLMNSEMLEAPDRAHIARHDPARVLAECDAKRRIIADSMGLGPDGELRFPSRQHGYPVRCLALPYADHPDYQPEWRP